MENNSLPEMLASRPGLGLKAVEDHFLEVLVLIGGLGHTPKRRS